MFKFSKSHAYSIGVDIGDDSLKLVQLGEDGNGINLIAGQSENLPEVIKAGSSQWQRWAIETIRQLASKGGFQGKEVIAALPANEIFIDNIKMPKSDGNAVEEAIFSKIKQKLPFEPIQENTMIKYIPMEQDNALVIATERKIIDRHLAIYEKVGLSIKSIGIWPTALANCYSKFFGRRKLDIETIVMLVCIETNYTNVVICRHNNLLFARSLSTGISQLNNKKSVNKLVLDLTECRRQFTSMNPRGKVGRLVFLTSQTTIDKEMCVTIAKQLDVPAQVGDCLAAVEISEPCRLGVGSGNDKDKNKKATGAPIERRKCEVNWATAFGLSLS